MTVPFAGRCSLNIPFPSWARDDEDRPELDFENWKELQRWADRLIRECISPTAPTIDMGDGAVLTGWSKPWYFPQTTTLNSIVGVLVGVDSGTTIAANVARDGVVVGTAQITAGESIESNDGPFEFPAGTLWQMQVTTGSATALGLSWFGVT